MSSGETMTLAITVDSPVQGLAVLIVLLFVAAASTRRLARAAVWLTCAAGAVGLSNALIVIENSTAPLLLILVRHHLGVFEGSAVGFALCALLLSASTAVDLIAARIRRRGAFLSARRRLAHRSLVHSCYVRDAQSLLATARRIVGVRRRVDLANHAARKRDTKATITEMNVPDKQRSGAMIQEIVPRECDRRPRRPVAQPIKRDTIAANQRFFFLATPTLELMLPLNRTFS